MLKSVNAKNPPIHVFIIFFDAGACFLCNIILKYSQHLNNKAMKQATIVTSIFFLMVLCALNVNARQVVTTTDSYVISTDNQVDLSANFEKSWVVEYGEKQISVFKYETKRGEEYIVRNDFFEVRYVNTEKGFGVKEIHGKQAKVAAEINNAVINPLQMQQQALLSQVKLDEEKALNYIASFVPFLLNNNYSHLLN
jgi:hypothetical protein